MLRRFAILLLLPTLLVPPGTCFCDLGAAECRHDRDHHSHDHGAVHNHDHDPDAATADDACCEFASLPGHPRDSDCPGHPIESATLALRNHVEESPELSEWVAQIASVPGAALLFEPSREPSLCKRWNEDPLYLTLHVLLI